MYEELHQLLILNNELPIPGIGSFVVNKKPAEADFVEKLIHPPVYSIILQQGSGVPAKNFFPRLAEILNVSDNDAVVLFNDFALDLKKKITGGDKVTWNGIGTLSLSASGNIKFLPADIPSIEESVAVEKVLREHTGHIVLVGEQERTSVEMAERLSQTESKKSKWWIAALVAGVILLVFVFWILSKNNWTISATSNNQTISTVQEGTSYILLQ